VVRRVPPAGGPPGALDPRINLEVGGPSRLPLAGWGFRHAVRYRTQSSLLPSAISDRTPVRDRRHRRGHAAH